MKKHTARGAVALTLGASLLLSACGADATDDSSQSTAGASPSASATAVETAAPAAPTEADIAALDAVTVTGDPGTEPTLTFATPFTTSADLTRVVTEGTGEVATAESLVTLQLVTYTGADGVAVQSTWSTAAFEAMLDGNEVPPAMTEALIGQKVGARLLFASPQTNTDGSTTTLLFAADLISSRVVPQRAVGEAVAPVDGLPTVTLDETGKPSISIPAGVSAPTELVAQPLIKGTGAVVESGQAITVHYTGWQLSDGTQFDSSWDRGTPYPTVIGAGKVIAGWDQAIVGQQVGSKLLIAVPKALAYGDKPEHMLANEDLIFVIEIVAAT